MKTRAKTDDKWAPRGLRFMASLPSHADGRVLWPAAVAVIISAAVATETVGAGLLPIAREVPVSPAEDPVLASFKETPIRLSDVRAQAGRQATEASPRDLIENGYLEDAADQLALAEAAREAGLDQALEVRAQLALAERRVLAEAYLDLAVRQAASEEKVRAAYDAETAALAASQQVSLAHILVSSQVEADALREKIERGSSFSEIAQRRSLDQETNRAGGSFGLLSVSELPSPLRDAASTLPIGTVSEPMEGEGGWHLVMVEVRRGERLPSFEERREAIAASLRRDAMARTAVEVRARRDAVELKELPQEPTPEALVAAETRSAGG